MALSLYVGPPGSGKSYEAIHSVVLPAYQAGRDIITNIKGVKPDYWAENVEPAKDCQLGTITVVPEEFFHDEMNYPLMANKKPVVDDDDGFDVPVKPDETLAAKITPGALVVIDEAYMVFPTGADSGVTKRMIEYVRTHRHFVDANGVASDLVLISQDVASIHPRIRAVSEFVVAVRNMRHLGMNGRYRVDVFNNWKMSKASAIGQSQRRYKKHIFDLYKSFEAEGAAKVVMTDKSHRALKPHHFVFLLLAVGALIYAFTRVNGARQALSAKTMMAEAGTNPASPDLRKPECSGSGVLVDLKDRRVYQSGEWRPVNAVYLGKDGRSRWDVGPCIVAFGAGITSGRDTAQNGG